MVKNKALFLDRDGVINVDHGYVYEIKDFIFNERIFDIIIKYQKLGYLIIVITNQSGIARGFYTEEQFSNLSVWMQNEMIKKGVIVNKIYHCPHHPDFTGECSCRKPNIGMILQAEEDFNIDLFNSVLIGDKQSDIQAGESAGIGVNLLIDSLT